MLGCVTIFEKVNMGMIRILIRSGLLKVLIKDKYKHVLTKNTVKVWLGPNILYFDSNKVSNMRKIFFW